MELPQKNRVTVGPFTVRELSMRENLDVQREYPEPGVPRAMGYLARAVSNGDDRPIGEAVYDLSAAWFNALMDAYNDVSRRSIDGSPLVDAEERAEGKG